MSDNNISICLCTYNGEKYLFELLTSLINQSLQPNEIVVYDDVSSDKTLKIVNQFALENTQILWKINKQTTNKGWKINFHDALADTTGAYVFLCDQDDIWDPNKIEKMVTILDENSQIKLLTSNYDVAYEGSYARKLKKSSNNLKVKKVTKFNSFLNPARPGCTYAVRREIIVDYLSIWKPNFAHDAMLWRISFLKQGLYNFNFKSIKFRRHESNASSFYGRRFSKNNYYRYYENILIISSVLDEILKLEHTTYTYKKILSYKKWNDLRLRAYENRKFMDRIRLLFMMKYYQSLKSVLIDQIFIYFYKKMK